MTLKIVKGQGGQGKLIQLSLVETPAEAATDDDEFTSELVRWVTAVLMARLKVPETQSIVGLLGVATAASNADEIAQWVACQRDLVGLPESDLLATLELRFKRRVNGYPEP
ncbi:MAG: hypothetical protein JJ979_23560 [Roseibium sp.]|nr:hypothetical protein [Roseibium sp.]